LKYFGHIMHANQSMEKQITLGCMTGSRRRRRLRTRWWDSIKEITGLTLQQLKEATRNYAGWKKVPMSLPEIDHDLMEQDDDDDEAVMSRLFNINFLPEKV